MKLYKRNKLLFGVGINDANYNVCKTEQINGRSKIVWKCPFYTAWSNMLARCYDINAAKNNPSYCPCSVVSDWLYFSVFKSWMEEQKWQGKHLDKDLLVPGNKVYSPEACVFVDPSVNTFVIETNAGKSQLPIGVYWNKRDQKYVAQCNCVITGKRVFLGYHLIPLDAHKAWLSFKLEQAKILAQNQEDPRVAAALIARYENYSN